MLREELNKNYKYRGLNHVHNARARSMLREELNKNYKYRGLNHVHNARAQSRSFPTVEKGAAGLFEVGLKCCRYTAAQGREKDQVPLRVAIV